MTHLSWLNSKVFCECYANRAPFEDLLKSTFRDCQILAQKGRYNEALARMNGISPERQHSLKSHQHWTFLSGVLQLRRRICRDDRVAADYLLSQLQEIQLPDADISLLLTFLSIEYYVRKGHYNNALDLVEQTAKSIQQGNFDIQYQIKLLCLKARIFERTFQPQRGFSLAMRAARIAYRSRLLPGLWEAISTLAAVLLGLREFTSAKDMIESIMPQILELEDCELAARGYSLLADANMGVAGSLWRQGSENTPARKEYVNRALGYIDCAYDQFEKIDDVIGQCEMMAKKATTMHLTGDLMLANDYAAKYLDLRRQNATEKY